MLSTISSILSRISFASSIEYANSIRVASFADLTPQSAFLAASTMAIFGAIMASGAYSFFKSK